MPQITNQNQLPSVSSLRRFANRGGEFRFLEFNAFRDVAFHIDDFDGDTINLDYYALANSGAAGAANFAIAVAASTGTGAVRATTSTNTDNASVSLIGPLIYKGDNHAGMWARFRAADVTSLNFEVGFIDAVPGSNGSGVSDVDTPAATMADGALVQMDTDQTDTGLDFVTVGSTANQTVKATSLSGVTPVNAVWMDVVVQLVGNDAYCTLRTDSGDGTTMGVARAMHNDESATGNTAGYVEGGVALAPWVYVRSRAAASRTFDIDAIATWSYRVAQ